MTYPEKGYRKRISFGQSNNALTLLIIMNLVVFVILTFIHVTMFFLYRQEGQAALMFQEKVLKWFVLPASTGELGARPWTVITYMFTHTGVLHILGNTLWLWAFGYILQDLTGNRKLAPLYIYGGLAGAFAFLLSYNLFPGLQAQAGNSVLLGASAGIMAIAVAATMIAPGYRIFPMLNGGIPLWIITVLYLVIDLATIPSRNAGGHIAHLGGAFMGFLFIIMFRRGYDWSEWMSNFFDWVNNLFNPGKPRKGKSVKEELFYHSQATPFRKTPHVTQQRVDAILDKISQKGYQYLTEEEKELLKRASQEDL